ncbi:hypothetical protein ACHAW5_000808 [Stephanodiscus triporus]|uniref:Biogenesis of lysosome-related organelles complex 1 subunit 1 n=1 Tax=Stephanodiscus triporus TaxID=2934178 RepID=A0ABD3MM83_9STRA
MALLDDSDYEVVDARPDFVGSNEEKDGSVREADATNSNLNASNLEEHDRNNAGGGLENRRNEDGEDGGGSDAKTQVGAGLLFGLSGLFLGGPVLGLLSGVGAAVVASNDGGPAGDAARSAGAFAVATGSAAGEAARDVNERHGILDRIKDALDRGWGGVRRFDEEHRIGEKAKDAVDDVRQRTVEFEREHHLMQSILEGVQSGVDYLLDKLKGATAACDGHAGVDGK